MHALQQSLMICSACCGKREANVLQVPRTCLTSTCCLQQHITNAINYVVFAFFLADLGLNIVARGFLLTPNAYMHVRPTGTLVTCVTHTARHIASLQLADHLC